MKRVGAVICNFNKKEDVLNCIQSVRESKYTDYDLYVVDNASSDGSAEAIREKYGSQVTVLVNAENLGGSGGFNTGLRKALEKDTNICIVWTMMCWLMKMQWVSWWSFWTHTRTAAWQVRACITWKIRVLSSSSDRLWILKTTVPKPNSLEKPMQTEFPMSNIPMRLPPAL